jgi:hypothetical protein
MTSVLFSGFVVVMLALSRLANTFCALNAFRAVGVESRRVGKHGLPTRLVLASAMPVIPYVGQRRMPKQTTVTLA